MVLKDIIAFLAESLFHWLVGLLRHTVQVVQSGENTGLQSIPTVSISVLHFTRDHDNRDIIEDSFHIPHIAITDCCQSAKPE